MVWRPKPSRPYHPRDRAVTSSMMAAVRNKNSRAELLLRRAVWAIGGRYRLHTLGITGRPDMVFTAARVVVFVDGDFWHGRGIIEDGRQAFAGTMRTRRRDWWVKKITRNVERDRFVTAELRRSGWRVLRFWESDVLRRSAVFAGRVVRAVEQRRAKASPAKRRTQPPSR